MILLQGRFSHVEVIMSSLGYITIHSPTAVTQFLVGHGIKTTLGIMEFYKANQTVLVISSKIQTLYIIIAFRFKFVVFVFVLVIRRKVVA